MHAICWVTIYQSHEALMQSAHAWLSDEAYQREGIGAVDGLRMFFTQNFLAGKVHQVLVAGMT